MHKRWVVALAIAGLAVAASACSDDDEMTGPEFGDLVFTPSFEDIQSERSTELTLRNAVDAELGPVLVGVDAIKQTAMPDELCSQMTATADPPQISSLAPGEEVVVEVTIDVSDVGPTDCEATRYDADVFAAVGSQLLGGATIRFDWSP